MAIVHMHVKRVFAYSGKILQISWKDMGLLTQALERRMPLISCLITQETF